LETSVSIAVSFCSRLQPTTSETPAAIQTNKA